MTQTFTLWSHKDVSICRAIFCNIYTANALRCRDPIPGRWPSCLRNMDYLTRPSSSTCTKRPRPNHTQTKTPMAGEGNLVRQVLNYEIAYCRSSSTKSIVTILPTRSPTLLSQGNHYCKQCLIGPPEGQRR